LGTCVNGFTEAGITNVKNSPWIIYPNPCLIDLKVKVSQPGMVKIVDLIGNVLLENYIDQGVNTINIAHLSPGIYQIVFKGEVRRFILN